MKFIKRFSLVLIGITLGVSFYVVIKDYILKNNVDNAYNRAVSIAYPFALKEYYTRVTVELMQGSRVLSSEPILTARIPNSDIMNYITLENDLLAYFRFSSPLPKKLPSKLSDANLEEAKDYNYLRVTDSTEWKEAPVITDETWTRVGQMDIEEKKRWIKWKY